jgi:hypothetical protein
MPSYLIECILLSESMLLRYKMVDELVSACEAVPQDAAWATVEVAQEAGRTVMGGGDVTGQVTFASKGFGTGKVLASMARAMERRRSVGTRDSTRKAWDNIDARLRHVIRIV